MGTQPPPVGGVTTFLRRHLSQLEAAGVPFTARDWLKMRTMARLRWLLHIAATPKLIRLEFNSYETWTMAAVVLRFFPANILYRIHSGGPEARLSPLRRWILRRFLKRVNEVVLVGPHVRQIMIDAGFQLPSNERIEPAFLPPPLGDEEQVMETYGEDGRKFLADHSPLLVIQGSTFGGTTDLYGSDMAVDALLQLRADYPRLGLIIGRPIKGSAFFQAHCARLADMVDEAGAAANMWILDGEREFWPLIKAAHVFLRPTTSDGDSIGVREALFFDIPVVASDVAPRPPGVRLFPSRDNDAFARAIRRVLGETWEDPCS
ncbi:MAG: glycosyltransferase involved in cell wall biosynthesis [Rhodothermales bacterium]|jgi:glycosyltransferase involved in cell wall biosynthesis